MDFHRVGQSRQRRDGISRVRGKSTRRLVVASPDSNLGFGHLKETMVCSSSNSHSICFSGSRIAESSLSQNTDRNTVVRSTEMFQDEEMLCESEVRPDTPSVVEKLMGLEKLPLQHGFRKEKSPNPFSVSLFQHQKCSKVMDSSTAVTRSNDVSAWDLSFPKPQNSTSSKHLHEVDRIIPQQARRKLVNIKPYNVNVLRDIKSSSMKSTARIPKEDAISSKRFSYQAIHRPSQHLKDLNRSSKSLLYSLTDTVNSAVGKALPKRLKTTSQHNEIRNPHGEMFAPSDREMKSKDLDSSVVLRIINEKSVRPKEPAIRVLSSTFNRLDGLKNESSGNRPLPRHSLFSSAASQGLARSNKQVTHDERRYSIKDILNLRARNLLKTPEKSLMKSDKNETRSDETDMNFAPSSMDCIEFEPQFPESCQPDRQMSPVSVLEHQFNEDNSENDPFFKPNNLDVIARNTNEGMDCQLLLNDGFCEDDFIDNEERDYSYLLDMLILSGIHAINQERLYNAGWVLKYPVEDFIFEKLEKKYGKLVSWRTVERRLFFNRINSILGEILAPCMDLHPWIHRKRRLAPMWGSDGLVEKVWEMLIKENKNFSVGKAEDKVLDGIWLDLENSVNEIGMHIEKKLLQEILEEFVSELM